MAAESESGDELLGLVPEDYPPFEEEYTFEQFRNHGKSV